MDPSWRNGNGDEGEERGDSVPLLDSLQSSTKSASTSGNAETTTTASSSSSSWVNASNEAAPVVIELNDTTSLTKGRPESLSSDDNQGWEASRVGEVLPYLYGSHLLSRWGDRMWEFAVGLFMIEVWPTSLLLAAVYGLTEAASIAIFGVIVGNWVDRTSRLKVVQISLGVQNSSIIIAGIAMVALLGFPGSSLPGGSRAFITLVVVVNVSGAFARLSGLANNLVVERDWVVVISENQATEMLAQMNSVMRRIDLSCKLLAPVLVGALMSSLSPLWCAVTIASWNAASFGFEYWFLHKVYWSVTSLGLKASSPQKNTEPSDFVLEDTELLPTQGSYQPVEVDEDVASHEKVSLRTRLWENTFAGWRVYCRQEVALPGFSLALLYFTVLSFGSLMTAVLNWRGVPAFVLGLARGVAALIGILATVAYPLVHSRLKTIRTGLWSIWIQWSLLSLCATSVLVHNGIEASTMLIAGVAASRFGLWMFDLAVTQLMQEAIPEHQRGVVGGVQNSLQSIMDMLSYVMAIIISDPNKFWIPVIMSYGSVGLAAVLYASYAHKARGHLLHLDRLFQKFREL
ncbi:unnamed protein product [Calypogeia fissa]